MKLLYTLIFAFFISCSTEPEPACSIQLSSCDSLDDFYLCIDNEHLCCTATITNTGDLTLSVYFMKLYLEYIDFKYDYSSTTNWLSDVRLPVDSTITFEKSFKYLDNLNGDIDRITTFRVDIESPDCYQ